MLKSERKISEKTIERLSAYRRHLREILKEGKIRVYSHELSKIVSGTAAQVRRDLMEVGCSGCSSKGYDVDLLIKEISALIDCKEKQNVALFGVGNLGRALLGYFSGARENFDIVASFDIAPDKCGRVICGRRCYCMDQLAEVVKKHNITAAILAVPAENAEKTAQIIIENGIKAILNFAPRHINTGDEVYLETLDMTSALEKTLYFSRKLHSKGKSS